MPAYTPNKSSSDDSPFSIPLIILSAAIAIIGIGAVLDYGRRHDPPAQQCARSCNNGMLRFDPRTGECACKQ